MPFLTADSDTEQPPSGGCVLKQQTRWESTTFLAQPPSGGCVLKLSVGLVGLGLLWQPPSGGCVLKLCEVQDGRHIARAAAFGRLCVET